MRQALAALAAAGLSEGSLDLERKLRQLEALDEQRREATHQPVVEFRRAMNQLKDWASVWKEADMDLKNKLLREAGVRVVVGRLPVNEVKRPPMHILSISAENPAFEMALALAFAKGGDKVRNRLSSHLIPPISMRLGEMETAAVAKLLPFDATGAVALARPWIPREPSPVGIPAQPPGGPWVTAKQFSERSGVPRREVLRLALAGSIESTWFPGHTHGWRLIPERELVRLGYEQELREEAA